MPYSTKTPITIVKNLMTVKAPKRLEAKASMGKTLLVLKSAPPVPSITSAKIPIETNVRVLLVILAKALRSLGFREPRNSLK